MIKKIMVCLIPVICLSVLWATAAGEVMSVQVKEAELRASPSFLGKIVGRLNYGDQVSVNQTQGPWKSVGGPLANGWIHTSALTTKTIVLKAGDKNAELAASSNEVALAGKGFNKQVEVEFRSRNPKMNFAWVDRMEAITVSQKEMAQFVQQGDLHPQGGEQ
jgi:hypothetical protein